MFSHLYKKYFSLENKRLKRGLALGASLARRYVGKTQWGTFSKGDIMKIKRGQKLCKECGQTCGARAKVCTVSYTHLTLPTKA